MQNYTSNGYGIDFNAGDLRFESWHFYSKFFLFIFAHFYRDKSSDNIFWTHHDLKCCPVWSKFDCKNGTSSPCVFTILLTLSAFREMS